MLPLVSTTSPRLTGTRSLLKCVIYLFLAVLEEAEVSLRRPETNRPLASVTVAVTLMSSTPVRKRKTCGSCAS